MKEYIKLVFAIALSIVFVVNGIMIGWEGTRREAQDKALIIMAEQNVKESCIASGGNINNEGNCWYKVQ